MARKSKEATSFSREIQKLRVYIVLIMALAMLTIAPQEDVGITMARAVEQTKMTHYGEEHIDFDDQTLELIEQLEEEYPDLYVRYTQLLVKNKDINQRISEAQYQALLEAVEAGDLETVELFIIQLEQRETIKQLLASAVSRSMRERPWLNPVPGPVGEDQQHPEAADPEDAYYGINLLSLKQEASIYRASTDQARFPRGEFTVDAYQEIPELVDAIISAYSQSSGREIQPDDNIYLDIRPQYAPDADEYDAPSTTQFIIVHEDEETELATLDYWWSTVPGIYNADDGRTSFNPDLVKAGMDTDMAARFILFASDAVYFGGMFEEIRYESYVTDQFHATEVIPFPAWNQSLQPDVEEVQEPIDSSQIITDPFR